MDKDTLAVTDGVELISHTPKLKAIKFTKPILGDWFFEVRKCSFKESLCGGIILCISFLSI